MTYTARQLAERIESRLDIATYYGIGNERETRVAIIEAEIAAILRMAEATIRDQLSRVRVCND